MTNQSDAAKYGTSTIKRDRRTKEQLARLDKQIVDVLRRDNPQSVRHVFYRMTDPRLPEPVEKSERGYRHVQARLKALRRDGSVPYGWVSDSTRRGYHTPTYNNAAEFLRQVKGLYRAPIWKESPYHIEVWVESRSIAGVLVDLCEELAVSLYPCGGFASITLAYEAAEQINNAYDECNYVVLYVGDYDPAGVLIDKALEAEIRTHLNPSIDLDFIRVGITPDQIAEYNLPTKPRKLSDKRAQEISRTVEAEALPAEDLREILRDEIESYLPDNAREVARAAEASEGLLLDGLVGMPNGGGRHERAPPPAYAPHGGRA